MASPSLRMVRNARGLRQTMTPAEKIVWKMVRDRKLDGYKFLRQYPIPYTYESRQRWVITDFYCAEKRLILELDGTWHDGREQLDHLRDSLLEGEGYRILRLQNVVTLHEKELRQILLFALEKIASDNPFSPPSLRSREGGHAQKQS